MKLVNLVSDLSAFDSRARSGGKDPAEASADARAPFADVLSDIDMEGEAGDLPTLGQGARSKIDASAIDPAKSSQTVLTVALDVFHNNIASSAPVSGTGSTEQQDGIQFAGERQKSSVEAKITNSKDFVTMFLTSSSPPKTTAAPAAETMRRASPVKDSYVAVAEQLETVASQASEADAGGPANSSDPDAATDTPEIHRQSSASPDSLMAMFFTTLSGPQTVGKQAVDSLSGKVSAAVAAGSPCSPSFLSEALTTDSKLPTASSVPSLSIVADARHLAPATARSSAEGVQAVAPEPSMPSRDLDQRSPAPVGVDGARLVKPANLDKPTGGPSSTEANRSIRSRPVPAAAASERSSDALSSQAESIESPAHQDAAARSDHDTRSGDIAVHRRDPSQPEPATLGASRSSQGTASAVKLADEVTKLAATAATPSTAAIAPARTLALRLEQADMGPISIRMHVTGTTLDLHLAASDQETLAILRRDRETLAAAIEDRQYQVHSLVIQDSASSAPMNSSQTNQNNLDTGARPDMQASANHRGDRNNGNRDSGLPRKEDETDSSQPSARGPRRDSLFV